MLIDIDATLTGSACPAHQTRGYRFGLYGVLAHLMGSTELVSCESEMASMPNIASPLSAPASRLTGTVCLAPLQDRSAVRGCLATYRATGFLILR